MDPLNQCSYCYLFRYSIDSSSGKLCKCRICLKCQDYLISKGYYNCPFCASSFSLIDSNIKNLKDIDECSDILDSKILKLQELKSFWLLKLKKLKVYNFVCKIQRNQGDLLKVFQSLYSSFQALKIINDLNLFHIKQLNPKFFNNFTFINLTRNLLKDFSKFLLLREQKRIESDEISLFSGISVGCIPAKHGKCSTQFKVLSQGPCQLIALGAGISPGASSSIFFFTLVIFEDEKVVYFDEPNIPVINSDSRLTYEFRLKEPVILKSGPTYMTEFSYSAHYFYSFKISTDIMETRGIKIKFIVSKGDEHNLFYLKLIS